MDEAQRAFIQGIGNCAVAAQRAYAVGNYETVRCYLELIEINATFLGYVLDTTQEAPCPSS